MITVAIDTNVLAYAEGTNGPIMKKHALDLTTNHQFGIWDAIVLAAAADASARLLLSEALQDGFTWSGVTVTDPCASKPHPLLAALRKPRTFCVGLSSYLVTQGMSRETWQEQLRRGTLDLAILLSVSSGPRYGLAIIQHLEQFTDLVVAEGTIYPILGRLTREGLLDATWVENEAPHPRKYYALTRAGARRLTEMTRDWRAFVDKIDRLMAAAERARS